MKNNLLILEKQTIKQALKLLKLNGKKCLIVIDEYNKRKVLGTLTDGDIRRKILKTGNLKGSIKNLYNKKPIIIRENQTINKKKCINILLKKKIELIPLVDLDGNLKKIIFLNNLIKKKFRRIKTKNKTQVIIMAGGKGTRLKPFTEILPKPLMIVNSKTIIENIINSFVSQGFFKFIITLNYKSEILKSYFKELNLKHDIKFIEESKELGTVGSIRLIKNLKSNFILTNCDSLYKFEFSKMYKYHVDHKNDLTLAVAIKTVNIPYGKCEVFNKNDLKKIVEKPKLKFLVNTGFYILNKSVIKYIPKNKKFDMDEFLSVLIKLKFKVKTYKIGNSKWLDTGEWEVLKKTLNKLN